MFITSTYKFEDVSDDDLQHSSGIEPSSSKKGISPLFKRSHAVGKGNGGKPAHKRTPPEKTPKTTQGSVLLMLFNVLRSSSSCCSSSYCGR
jgi:hypothetical protein